MYHAVLNIVCFETFSAKCKENELHRKYLLFGGPAGQSGKVILPTDIDISHMSAKNSEK